MLLPLDAADPATAGGKAGALIRLQRAGVPMPRGWVLPFGAFTAFLQASGLAEQAAEAADDPEAAADLTQKIAAARLPAPLRCPAPCVAVRSSAGDEDRRDASAAGQYRSELGVGPDTFEAAVLRCWASWFGARAAAYRRHRPGDHPGPARMPQMALLVQEMVDARVSGVMFTVSPLTGSWQEMPVEAVWGLGERLVSGQVVPDRYRLSRPRWQPGSTVERVAGVIARPLAGASADFGLSGLAGRIAAPLLAPFALTAGAEAISRQDHALVLERGRVVERPTEAPQARKLSAAELNGLGRIGLWLERICSEPQDVEWAQDRAGRFLILQSRPISTRLPVVRDRSVCWTRRFIGERFPEGVTPLSWSILAPILEWFIAYPDTSRRYLGGEPPLRLIGGHPYLNVTVFRHLAFKLPGRPPPRFMLEFFPPEEESRWLRRWAAAPDWRVYASIFETTFAEKRWERFRWNPLRNHRAWAAFRRALPARLDELRRAAPASIVAVGSLLIRDYIKIHITSLLFANLSWQLTANRLDPADRPLLLRAPGGTITARVNRELWLLGHDPDLLPGFLDRHGHRGVASWEIFSLRWSEQPAEVLRLAALWRDRPDPLPRLQEEDRQTAAAMQHLRPGLLRAVRLTQEYLKLREEQRYHFDAILALLKQRLTGLARAAAPIDPADIPFLRADEFDRPETWADLVAARRREIPLPAPPTFVGGEEAVPLGDARRLQGLGISAGIVRGRVRVVRDIHGLELLQAGEILVARATDPSWTPAFARAGGLLLEMGSLLSHGAVVAREFHLPGVVNLPGIMERVVDGREVVLDGESGGVWLV